MNNGEIYTDFLKEIFENGNELAPRGLKIKELINTNKMFNIEELSFDLEGREFNWKYLAAELLWYISGDLDVKDIGKFANLWNKIANEQNKVNSNYGHIVFLEQLPASRKQYEFVLEEFIKDIHTRQALIRYNSHKHAFIFNKDKPCTISNQFLIRDNKINCIVNMRSNDLFYGFSYDLPWFGLLTQSLYLDLKETYKDLELGNLYWNTGSSHIYDDMFNKTEIIINNNVKNVYKFELTTSLYKLHLELNKYTESNWNKLINDYKGNEKQFIIDVLKINITNAG